MESCNQFPAGSLGGSLDHEPVELRFGTSGRRGKVIHLSQLEVYLNVVAEIEYLVSLPAEDGGIQPGQHFYIGHDLRPSSTRFVPDQADRGEIAQAVAAAISDAGLEPVNLGAVPVPALASYALSHKRGCIMVTGSHIPFDLNGYKTYSAKGELRKKDEAPITVKVAEVRRRLYSQPLAESKFNKSGMLRCGHSELPSADEGWRTVYANRYYDFLCGSDAGAGYDRKTRPVLDGLRVLVYEHSAVGRDLLAEMLASLGSTVVRAGRSEQFVPIDTENFDTDLSGKIHALVVDAWLKHGRIDAVVSTDGDGDRPLVLGVHATPDNTTPCQVRFFGGDLVGMVTAEFLKPDAVVVPISCNDGIDLGPLRHVLQPKTRIGSPYVIAGIEQARKNGCRAVCGFEANGGFFVGTDIRRNSGLLRALPTRDAMLPILCVLARAREDRVTLTNLFDRLPRRFSKAALLRQFPRAIGRRIVEHLSPTDDAICEVAFLNNQVSCYDSAQGPLNATAEQRQALIGIRDRIAGFFGESLGFGSVIRINYTDGVRVWFDNGDVAHVRPSGNADELRIYAVADTQQRADAIASMAVRQPDGILRQMERALT